MRKGPPIPGGVVWWDEQGEQFHTPWAPVPSRLAIAATVCLFAFISFIIGGALIAMGATFAGEEILYAGIVVAILSIICMMPFLTMRFIVKETVIPMLYPGLHYLTVEDPMEVLPPGCKLLYLVGANQHSQPPKWYEPPFPLPMLYTDYVEAETAKQDAMLHGESQTSLTEPGASSSDANQGLSTQRQLPRVSVTVLEK